MGLTIWASAKAGDVLILREGGTVSVATIAGSPPTLKWKRENKDKTWATDGAAVPIADLEAADDFTMEQLTGGAVLIGNGRNKFFRTKTNDPKTADDFEEVFIIE